MLRYLRSTLRCLAPFCQFILAFIVVTCPALQPGNGNVTGNSIAYGAAAVVQCFDGYRIGNSSLQQQTVVCAADGQWQPDHVTCERTFSGDIKVKQTFKTTDRVPCMCFRNSNVV